MVLNEKVCRICRICLKGKIVLNWNQEIDDNSGMSYKDCYYKYTKLQEIALDSLPTDLCRTCSRGLKNAYLLFEKAIESFHILHNSLKTDELKAITYMEEQEVPSKEIGKNETTMKFEIQILDDNLGDIFEEETLKDNNILVDINDNENVSGTKEITPLREEEIDVPVDFVEIKNNESSLEDLVKEQPNVDSNTESANCSTTTTTAPKTLKRKKKKLLMCVYCSLKVENIGILKRHEARHSENRQRTETCPHCDLKFYDKVGLNNHIKIHAENREKSFKCEFCDKAFFNRGALNVHRRIHLGQMVACRLCPKEFYRQIDLDKHLLAHSAGSLQKNVAQSKYVVQCQYCNESVITTKWKAHKAAHLGQPQVKCKICDKNFFSKDKCTRHLKRFHRKTRDDYKQFVHYYEDGYKRMSHLMIKQQEIVHPVTK